MARGGRGKSGGLGGGQADPDRYLVQRDNGWWHYKRRVPEHARHVDDREFSRKSLKTQSLEVARIRRDAFEAADNLFWAGMAAGDDAGGARLRYEAAQKRALTFGVVYRTADEIARDAPDEELLARVLTAIDQGRGGREALLGGVDRPNPNVSEAIDIYVDEIAAQDIANYSDAQRRSWEKVKRRASSNFVRQVGDRPVLTISREEAQAFWRWWQGRIEKEGLDPDTARRDFGNMRTLFREYARWAGVETANPFDGLSFKRSRVKKEKRPPYSVEWITDRLLAPGSMATLNDDARLILFTLIETGCRPSEICNIAAEHIRLDDPVPHLRIRHMAKRAVKTDPSERDIPLVGVALAAMRARPKGFARYRDKENGFSQMAMKYFRGHGLLETPRHDIYSLRHSMEKRMLEAGLDFDFRCRILGHRNTRPDYGDGGSMEWRRDQLAKVALPFDRSIVGG